MTDRISNILFLCTGNAVLSILGEGICVMDGATNYTGEVA